MNAPIQKDKFKLRPARPEDLEELFHVERVCFTLPWTRESIRYELEENPRALYLVLTETSSAGEKICGYCGCRYVLDEAEVMNIAVLPTARRQGGGQMLFRALMCELARRGIRRVSLEVREGNLAAQALYFQNGFSVCGRIKAYYSDNGEDALIMARMLS